MAESGRKDDTGKLRFDLIPAYPLERLAEVYTIGAKKYADRNWEKGLSYGRVFSAMMRHAWAWWRGETNDPVDGQHHLSSVAWCAFALIEYQHKGTGEDDRPIQVVAAAPVQVEWARPDPADVICKEDHQQERSGFDVCADPIYGRGPGMDAIKDRSGEKLLSELDMPEFIPCADCHSHVCMVAGTCTHPWQKHRS